MLNCLSLDAIVAITNELEGRDIARLWLCGDALLNHRLGRGGGVKKFSQTFDSLFPGTWPSIVRYFASLEEFTVRHSWDEVPEGEWKPRYSDLSKTVVRIRLAHPDDIDSFYEALLGGSTPNLLELTNVSSAMSYILTEEVLASLMAHRPRLEILLFDHLFPLPLLPSVWPGGLRKLRFNALSLGEDSIVLPESLEELELRINETPSSLLSIQWPPNLLKLVLDDYYDVISLEELRHLPRSLTDLRLPNAHPLNSSWAFWKALPPSLTKLYVIFPEVEPSIALLPRTLKRFFELPEIDLENVKLLPPSLTKIDFVASEHDPKIYELLPTGLRKIYRLGSTHVRDEDESSWTRLPDTLEYVDGLNVRYLDHYALPSCLRELKLFGSNLTDRRLDRLVSSKLLILQLEDCKFGSEALIRCLPQGIVKLAVRQCVDFAMDGKSCKLLPKTLQTLIATPVKLTEPKALAYLPIGLNMLMLHSTSYEVGFLGDGASLLPKLKELNISVDKLTSGLALYLFATMPRNLRVFRFFYPKEFSLDITEASFESLPPGLVILHISTTPVLFSDRWHAQRPRCLADVYIGKQVHFPHPSERS